MRIYRLLIPLLIVALGSFSILSPTLAQYSRNNSGSDAALIAKWNFRVGANADNLHNQGFTFDVFDNQPLKPQDMGENSFIVSPGQSDVAIEYDVYMNVDVLLADIYGAAEGTDYPPLVFKVSSSSATVPALYDDWFALKDIEADNEGYFKVATGQFAVNSEDLVEITVHWWWNTSFYVGTPNADTSPSGNYYAKALNDYEDLVNTYNNRVNQANSFFDQHQRIVTTVDGVEQVTYNCVGGDSCPYGDSDDAHMAEYSALMANADSALTAVNNSLKAQYDDYDSQALAAIAGLDSTAPERILIKVVGSQLTPGQV